MALLREVVRPIEIRGVTPETFTGVISTHARVHITTRSQTLFYSFSIRAPIDGEERRINVIVPGTLDSNTDSLINKGQEVKVQGILRRHKNKRIAQDGSEKSSGEWRLIAKPPEFVSQEA